MGREAHQGFVRALGQDATGDEPAAGGGHLGHARQQLLDGFQQDVGQQTRIGTCHPRVVQGADEALVGPGALQQVGVQFDEFVHGRAAIGIDVKGRESPPAQQEGGQREDARAGADIEEGALEVFLQRQLLQQFHTEARGLVAPGAEGQARIHHQVDPVRRARGCVPERTYMKALADLEGAEAFSALGQPILVTEGFGLEETDPGEGFETRGFRGEGPRRKVDIAGCGWIGLPIEGG